MSPNVGVWYLHNSTSLEHQYHARMEESCTILDESSLDEEQRDLMWSLYCEGVGPTVVANIMTKLVKKKGKTGHFSPSRVNSITSRMQKVFDAMAGMGQYYCTQAERTVAKLNR